MSGFAAGGFADGLAVMGAVDVAIFGLTWLLARRLGRYNIVDVTWGLSIAAITVAAFACSHDDGGDLARRTVVLAMTCGWAARLALHIGSRNAGHGEDPRYEAILRKAPGSVPLYALKRVFLPQAVIAFAISIPLQIAMYERGGNPTLTVLGVIVWLLGITCEGVADAQLASFMKRRTSSEDVLDTGLWRYSRHPNYFGESLLWFGLWLPAAGHWQGLVAVLSPIVVTYLVAFASGKPLLEKGMAKRKPAYADYMKRTSGFIPLPPRKKSAR